PRLDPGGHYGAAPAARRGAAGGVRVLRCDHQGTPPAVEGHGSKGPPGGPPAAPMTEKPSIAPDRRRRLREGTTTEVVKQDGRARGRRKGRKSAARGGFCPFSQSLCGKSHRGRDGAGLGCTRRLWR